MKTCNKDGCNLPVWSKGACRKHAPRTPLKKKSPLTDEKKVLSDKTMKRNTFFMSIWDTRPHICQICDKSLGKEPRSYNFDHLLEKSKFPGLQWEKENILLVCLECHDCKTRGIISDKYQEKINFVITKFNVS